MDKLHLIAQKLLPPATVFKSRLDQMKMNIRNGKYFDGRDIIYTFHVIDYQYRGLPAWIMPMILMTPIVKT